MTIVLTSFSAFELKIDHLPHDSVVGSPLAYPLRLAEKLYS